MHRVAAKYFLIALFGLCVSDVSFGQGKIVAAGKTEKKGSGRKSAAVTEMVKSPKVGQSAVDFQWTEANGEKNSLSKLSQENTVVLLVLRGWPGYQCPLCSRQVGEFLSKKKKFERLGAHVVMVYPGPAELLEEHAKEFQGNKTLEGSFHFLIDPDYVFTNAWGLRWDAPRETAYPSTFVVGKGNKVAFENVSKTHGGRVKAARVLAELKKSAK